jgi:hypothetical protein
VSRIECKGRMMMKDEEDSLIGAKALRNEGRMMGGRRI